MSTSFPSISKLIVKRHKTNPHFTRQNPAIFSNVEKVFTYVVQALEAETIQGAVAARVVSSAKQLVAATGVNVDQAIANVRPENQVAVRSYFQ